MLCTSMDNGHVLAFFTLTTKTIAKKGHPEAGEPWKTLPHNLALALLLDQPVNML